MISVLLKAINIRRFEVFTAVTIKNAVFWEVTQCSSCRNRRRVLQLVVIANVVPSSLILFTLMMQVMHSSETRAIQLHIPEEGFLHLQQFHCKICHFDTKQAFVLRKQT
jgi:hypothetical protein